MASTRRDKLVGPVVSLPTFCDEDHNLLLDRQRKHDSLVKTRFEEVPAI